ncbi:hypothetical protein MPRS_16660 [Mycobacterium paraseoulense]|nr:hypothetical protein MPRS_16660 [Mycobacterium paraseoulense]
MNKRLTGKLALVTAVWQEVGRRHITAYSREFDDRVLPPHFTAEWLTPSKRVISLSQTIDSPVDVSLEPEKSLRQK